MQPPRSNATSRPVSAATSPPDASTPGTAARAAVRRAPLRRRPARSRTHFLTGGICAAILLAGLAVGLPWLAGTRTAPDATPRAEAGPVRVGTMVMAPEGDQCRRMAFDNNSGAMWEVERVRCAGTATATAPVDSAEAVRQRYSGGRLEAIRKSFSDR